MKQLINDVWLNIKHLSKSNDYFRRKTLQIYLFAFGSIFFLISGIAVNVYASSFEENSDPYIPIEKVNTNINLDGVQSDPLNIMYNSFSRNGLITVDQSGNFVVVDPYKSIPNRITFKEDNSYHDLPFLSKNLIKTKDGLILIRIGGYDGSNDKVNDLAILYDNGEHESLSNRFEIGDDISSIIVHNNSMYLTTGNKLIVINKEITTINTVMDDDFKIIGTNENKLFVSSKNTIKSVDILSKEYKAQLVFQNDNKIYSPKVVGDTIFYLSDKPVGYNLYSSKTEKPIITLDTAFNFNIINNQIYTWKDNKIIIYDIQGIPINSLEWHKNINIIFSYNGQIYVYSGESDVQLLK